MVNNFEFVNISDPVANAKPGKSLQIRSRCMQGKNKREDSRRSIREKKRLAKESQQKATQVAVRERHHSTVFPIHPIGSLISDLGLLRFAGPDIDVEEKGILFKAFAYNVANQALSPLDRAVDFDCLETASFEWLFEDTAFLHSVLSASYAVNDLMYPQWDGKPGRKTLLHLRKTLSLLQEKLRNEHVYQDESVLVVVINLALLSAVFGDWEAAAAHFKGLQKIVELRGGIFNWDWRLVNIFQDFQYLSLRINQNVLKRARHNAACFQSVLTSLQSRLMHLHEQLENPVEELVRLTMLAFLTTTFKAPGRKIPYGWVNEQLRDAFSKGIGGIFEQDVSLRLWVLITAAFTVTGTQKTWVRDAWERSSTGDRLGRCQGIFDELDVD
ncbi:hypothetical protein N0V90_000362 [Kalmusia sp. IMI 367209]|nr:hypothetical protein N0V90_000362 [Kalmusia sp. IMI 367209]